MKWTKWLALVGVVLLPFAACTKKNKQPENLLRMAIESEPPTLDSAALHDHVSFEVLFNLMEGLTRLDDKMEAIPGLAEKWEVSKDGKTFTFTMRDAKWSDGVPVKAQDFVTSWRRLLDPKRAAEYSYFLFDIVNAEEFNAGKVKDVNQVGIKAIDDKHLEIKLKHPASYFLAVVSSVLVAPQRQDIIDAHPTDFTEPQYFKTTGPYMLTEWKHDSRVTLEPNPNYYGKKPKLAKLQFLVVKEDSTALNMYERGELEVALRIPSLELDRIKKRPDYKSIPMLRGYYYGFHTKQKPFDNVLVRKAFAHAIDRNELVATLKGGQVATKSWIPKGMMGFDENVGLDYNPELAKQLLAKAGYPGGKGFPAVTMMYDSLELNKLVAEKVQFLWKKVLGIENLEITTQEWKVFLDTLRNNTPPLWRMGWGADYADPNNFMDLFMSSSGNNNTHYKNPAYDKLVVEAATKLTPDARKPIYSKAQKMILEDDVIMVPLFQTSNESLVQPYVKGFKIDPIENPHAEDAEIDLTYDATKKP